jgi:hypothetical protein
VLTWRAPTWDGGSPITGYVVLRGSSPDALSELATLGLVQSYIDGDVTKDTLYYYSVYSVNEEGSSETVEVEEFVLKEQKVEPDGKEERGYLVPASVAVVALVAVILFVLWWRRKR